MFAFKRQVSHISRWIMLFDLCQLMHWRQQAPEYQLMQLNRYLDRPCRFFLWDCTKRILLYNIPQYQPLPIKICRHILFPCRFVIRANFPFPSYTSPNVLFSMYDMSTGFSFIVQTPGICCDAGQCIFSVAHPQYRCYQSTFVCYCIMIDDEQRTGYFYYTYP